MIAARFSHKLDMLTRGENQDHQIMLESAFRSGLLATAPGLRPGEGTGAGIFVDAAYAILRHRHWVTAPLFSEILTDFLATDHQVTRSCAESIVSAMTRPFAGLAGRTTGHVNPTDFEFLSYIFVISATSDNEEELVADLGIGRNLIRWLRNSVANVLEASDDDAGCSTYLPEVEAHITAILSRYAQETRAVPWALQVHRLSYLMLGATGVTQALLSQQGAGALFDTMVWMGRRPSVTASQFLGRIRRQGETVNIVQKTEDALALLHTLYQRNLAYPVRDSARDLDSDGRWRLTPQGEQLTAEAFATLQFNAAPLNMKEIAGLGAHYQAAALRLMTFSPDLAPETADIIRPLSGPVARALLQSYRSNDREAAFLDWVRTYLRDSTSAFGRNALVEALSTDTGGHNDIDQILQSVIESDSSAMVRATATRIRLEIAGRASRDTMPESMPPAGEHDAEDHLEG